MEENKVLSFDILKVERNRGKRCVKTCFQGNMQVP